MRADAVSSMTIRLGVVGAALVWSLVTLRALFLRPALRPALRRITTPERLRAAGLLTVATMLLVPVLLVTATTLRAQDEPTSPEVVIPQGTITSVTSVAHYDGGGRRDPFVPLYGDAVQGASGPRFETMELTGIFLGSGTNSLVVLEDPTHRGFFVRLGQQIGNARLVEIMPQAAVFEVREYGASRRVVLQLQRTQENR